MNDSLQPWRTLLVVGLAWALTGCSNEQAIAQDTDAAQSMTERRDTLAASANASDEAWFELAQEARSAGDVAIASDALTRVSEQFRPAQTALEAARIAVVGDDPEAAEATLQQLADSGYTGVRVITGDDLLASLSGRSGYDSMIETMTRQAFPCQYDEAFREFDFWVGTWDVHVASGQYAGQNRIEREEAGCVLTEHWQGASGTTGSSINYVDKSTGEWVQVWNSEGGAQIDIRGGLTDEGMRLVGHIHYVGNGTTADFRGLWTLLDDGRVRQFFEQSGDGGRSWTPWFEGFYTRRDMGAGVANR